MALCVDITRTELVLCPPLWGLVWLLAMRSHDQEGKGFPNGGDHYLSWTLPNELRFSRHRRETGNSGCKVECVQRPGEMKGPDVSSKTSRWIFLDCKYEEETVAEARELDHQGVCYTKLRNLDSILNSPDPPPTSPPDLLSQHLSGWTQAAIFLRPFQQYDGRSKD